MLTGRLLLRKHLTENSSLNLLVEKARREGSSEHYCELEIVGNTLKLKTRITSQPSQKSVPVPDEGFESDIDSISLLSIEETATPKNEEKHQHQETDSANGSACSDSDSDIGKINSNNTVNPERFNELVEENFNLVNCVCYADVNHNDTLIFIIKGELFVISFVDLEQLRSFYENFSTIKALAYSGNNIKSNYTKANLIQRTDSNGITHIEVERPFYSYENYEPASIISLSTTTSVGGRRSCKSFIKKSLSSENLLEDNDLCLRKVWNSSENFLNDNNSEQTLDSLTKIDKTNTVIKKRKVKGPAPKPPVIAPPPPIVLLEESKPAPKFHFLKRNQTQQMQSGSSYYQSHFNQKPAQTSTSASTFWKNSIPRLLKKKEPMAYRYIDTTAPIITPQHLHHHQYMTHQMYIPKYKPNPKINLTNRLFGMSSKLKDLSSTQEPCNPNLKYNLSRSLTNLSALTDNHSLKSVIKKDEKKKKDKKVTFSAYNTVQVL